MIRGRAALSALVTAGCIAGIAAGCGETAEAPTSPLTGELPAGVVARVGTTEIDEGTVVRIAAVQEVPLSEARDRAISDALWAAGAEQDMPATTVANARTRVLARVLLRQMWEEAASTPITQEEIDHQMLTKWTSIDRPIGYRVVHAVARTEPKDSDDKKKRARALAEKIREAVKPVVKIARETKPPKFDEERTFRRDKGLVDHAVPAFEEAARTVDPGGIEVVAEQLYPITAEGLLIDHAAPAGYAVHKAFAKAAVDLSAGGRGALSEVIESDSGFHVLLMLELTPERHLSAEERVAYLQPEILKARAERAQRALVDKLAAAAGVAISTNGDALMAEGAAFEGGQP